MDTRWQVAVGVAVAMGIAIGWLANRYRRQLRTRGRARRAIEGEAAVEKQLRRAGYEVLERQARVTLPMIVDGASETVEVRADLLVSRGVRRFVVEVKTGELAPKLSHGPTRRQLLEYSLAFACDGVLLATPDGALREVQFPLATSRAARDLRTSIPWWASASLGFAVGAAAAWAWLTR